MRHMFIAAAMIPLAGLSGLLAAPLRLAALPPPEETPEEVLRNRPLFEARSPEDGQLLSAAEYARLQAELQAREAEPPMSPDVQHNIFLLRLLKAVRILTPL